MSVTAKWILVASAVTFVGAAVAIKLIFFPSIKDDYFAMSQRSLRKVPTGLVVVRATHFPTSWKKGITYDSTKISGKQVWRMMGRNVTLQQLMAAAYGRNVDRVVIPVGAPRSNFDFLITTSSDQQQYLQNAIRKKLGYVGHMEKRDEEVLAMQIEDSSLPGLTVSSDNERQNVNFDKGKVYFTHMHLKDFTGGLEQVLKKPVVDKTELTNYYNFSIEMNAKVQQQLSNETNAAVAVQKILAAWGLKLEPDSDQVDMLVVRNEG